MKFSIVPLHFEDDHPFVSLEVGEIANHCSACNFCRRCWLIYVSFQGGRSMLIHKLRGWMPARMLGAMAVVALLELRSYPLRIPHRLSRRRRSTLR